MRDNLLITQRNRKICSIKVGGKLTITASFTSGATVKKLYVNVFGRSGLISREKLPVALNDNKYLFTIPATKEMTPSCRVVCYYVQISGEIVYDHLVFAVEPSAAHKVSLFQYRIHKLLLLIIL